MRRYLAAFLRAVGADRMHVVKSRREAAKKAQLPVDRAGALILSRVEICGLGPGKSSASCAAPDYRHRAAISSCRKRGARARQAEDENRRRRPGAAPAPDLRMRISHDLRIFQQPHHIPMQRQPAEQSEIGFRLDRGQQPRQPLARGQALGLALAALISAFRCRTMAA